MAEPGRGNVNRRGRPAASSTAYQSRVALNSAHRFALRRCASARSFSASHHGPGQEVERLPPEVETNLYRILQEALQNVHKHAGDRHVRVMLERRDGQAALTVEDDGRGFDPEAEAAGGNKGMGVTNMRDRASLVGGTLEAESRPGAGTTVFVRAPLNWPDADGGRE